MLVLVLDSVPPLSSFSAMKLERQEGGVSDQWTFNGHCDCESWPFLDALKRAGRGGEGTILD